MSTLKVAQEPMFLRGVEDNPKPSSYRDLIENAMTNENLACVRRF